VCDFSGDPAGAGAATECGPEHPCYWPNDPLYPSCHAECRCTTERVARLVNGSFPVAQHPSVELLLGILPSPAAWAGAAGAGGKAGHTARLKRMAAYANTFALERAAAAGSTHDPHLSRRWLQLLAHEEGVLNVGDGSLSNRLLEMLCPLHCPVRLEAGDTGDAQKTESGNASSFLSQNGGRAVDGGDGSLSDDEIAGIVMAVFFGVVLCASVAFGALWWLGVVPAWLCAGCCCCLAGGGARGAKDKETEMVVRSNRWDSDGNSEVVSEVGSFIEDEIQGKEAAQEEEPPLRSADYRRQELPLYAELPYRQGPSSLPGDVVPLHAASVPPPAAALRTPPPKECRGVALPPRPARLTSAGHLDP